MGPFSAGTPASCPHDCSVILAFLARLVPTTVDYLFLQKCDLLPLPVTDVAHTTATAKAGLCIASSLMQERDLLTLPLKCPTHPHRPAALTRLRVLKRISFEPGLMQSGVVAAEHNAPAGTALLFVKGAPSKMKPMLSSRSFPPDFQQVTILMCLCVCPSLSTQQV